MVWLFLEGASIFRRIHAIFRVRYAVIFRLIFRKNRRIVSLYLVLYIRRVIFSVIF